MLHPLTKEIRTKIREAVKLFGTYSYEDKGPHEVMDMGPLETKLKALPPDELKIVFNELGQTEQGAMFTESVYEILSDKMVDSLREQEEGTPVPVKKFTLQLPLP